MRLRQLVLACGFSSFVLSQYASALGLGEVKLNSTLNEPLNAEVKLLDTRDLTADQILVALASPADFERNNVDRLYFYTEFQFEVVLNGADGPKVLITSRNPVREPYLNFLIEARWTAGRLLREYTLLMDLPTFEQDGAEVAAQPARVGRTSTPAQRQATSAPVATRPAPRASVPEPAPARRTQSTAPATISGDQYQIRENDTLWEIALGARADNSVSVHQAMMALYAANPDAFINGNINMLRRGQVLRIPSASEMKTVSKGEAVSQFAQATGDSSLGAQLSASRRSTSTPSDSVEVSGRVKLAAPSSGSAGAGLGSGANDGAGKALEAELAATLEELDKSKAENTELSSRVQDLEAQISTMQRLVDVSNEKLRALQVAANQQAAEAAKAPAEETPATESPAVETAATEPAPTIVTEAESQSSVAEVAVAAAAVSSEATASAAASSVPAVQPQKVVTPFAPKPTLGDSLIANAPWIGLGILVIAGAGYFFYRRRKQNELEQEESQDDIFAMEPVEEVDDQATEEVVDQVEPDVTDFEEEEAPAVAETGDVVGEADIYIAYGKLDQAEEMLLNGLKKDPNSVDIRMKLLEVYAQQQNVSSFDKHYSALLPLAGGAVLARASELRDHIDGAGAFAPDTNSDSVNDNFLHPEESELDDFALDDFQLDDEIAPAAEAELTAAHSTDLDLDLSDEFAALDSAPTDTVVRKASGYEPELDLDLGSLDSTDDEFTLDLDDQETDVNLVSEDIDDLSELSLALDDLDADVLPEDITSSAPVVEEEFTFDFNDEQEAVDESLETDTTLDVAADDFNLDLDSGGVDLAALDHEMESLDVEFDEDETTFAEPSTTDASFDVDMDDDFADLDGSFNTEELNDARAPIDLADDNAIIELDETDELSLDEMELGLGDLEEPEPTAEDFNAAADETPIQDEDLFAEALSDFSNDSPDVNVNDYSSDASDLSDEDMDAELDFLADADEAATKLDLARAYIDMGDTEGAKDILAEVVHEGNEEQRKDAVELLGRIDV